MQVIPDGKGFYCLFSWWLIAIFFACIFITLYTHVLQGDYDSPGKHCNSLLISPGLVGAILDNTSGRSWWKKVVWCLLSLFPLLFPFLPAPTSPPPPTPPLPPHTCRLTMVGGGWETFFQFRHCLRLSGKMHFQEKYGAVFHLRAFYLVIQIASVYVQRREKVPIIWQWSHTFFLTIFWNASFTDVTTRLALSKTLACFFASEKGIFFGLLDICFWRYCIFSLILCRKCEVFYTQAHREKWIHYIAVLGFLQKTITQVSSMLFLHRSNIMINYGGKCTGRYFHPNQLTLS